MNGWRRRFLLAAGALAASPLAAAQSPTKPPHLAILSPNKYPTPQYIADNPFSNRLRELGWVEGETLLVERVYAEGREDRLAGLAEGIARKPVDVIWAIGPEKRATSRAARPGCAATRCRPRRTSSGSRRASSAWRQRRKCARRWRR